MEIDNKYRPIPFWSWNGELDEKKLIEQIDWMHSQGIGGFFMHARGGLTTEYLSDKWFSCVEACEKRALELGMEAYAYDENGWPSGFVGGKLLEDIENHDCYLTYEMGKYDPNAYASYDVSTDKLIRVTNGENVLNVYNHYSTSTADICNKDVVRKFIEMTHEEYKKHDIYKNLRGFFTDEPQYFRWGSSYTNVLPKYFKERYNEDIKDRLGLLFVEKEGYRDFRYKFWKSMQELMLDAFAKQIYYWCEDNNYKLTGHYVDESSLVYQVICCGGIMPYYQYEHIPGCDWLGRMAGNRDINPKQVSSVAAQCGKEQILTETFACCGWDVTPLEYKHIADYLYVNGVNLMCHHLLPYSEIGDRKRDYPAHFTEINPWIKKSFKEFNDYYSQLGYKLTKSKEIVDVALFQPIRSCYFNFKRHLNWCGVQELDESYLRTANELGSHHIQYHIIDETVMKDQKAHIEGSSLVVGLMKYNFIVFPKTYTMDKETEALLHEYILKGGKVLLMDEKPTYLEGNPYNYDYLKSNVTLEEMVKLQRFISTYNKQIRISYRKNEEGRNFFFIVNYEGPTSFELNGCNLEFDQYESKFIYEDELVNEHNSREICKLSNDWIIENKVDNYLKLDSLRYSLDGINYSESFNYMGILLHLIKLKFNGDLYIKYNFNVKVIPNLVKVLTEYQNLKEIYINGIKLNNRNTNSEIPEYISYEVSKYVKTGNNEITIKIPFEVSDVEHRCYYDDTITESIKNKLAMPTTVDPIFIVGDFGVYGDFEQGKDEEILLGENFYVAEQQKEVTSLIEQGFPFFRGDITLSQEIEVDNVSKWLFIEKRFQLVDVYVNNKFVKRMMFDRYVDLSNHLKVGKNKITFVLTVSNRNCFGPNHTIEQENLSVGPFSWELSKTWVDCKSEKFVDKYAFVKTII